MNFTQLKERYPGLCAAGNVNYDSRLCAVGNVNYDSKDGLEVDINSTVSSGFKQWEKVSLVPLAFNPANSRSMTREESAAYSEKLKRVGAFGVLDVPTHIIDNGIRTCREHNDPAVLQEKFSDMSKLALGDYNSDKGTRYQFVKVIRVNTAWTGNIWYYVTFQAKKNGFPLKNFQARICRRTRDEVMVEFCRVEPEPEEPELP
ncbi:hypothetical protein Vadar_019258 [Vaccinium darrowii]|uniref:Uncharacterized protein n=1 Tax=Vaccinium darrowii TaxID=229202 RepID=A0ACB7Y7R6_9ERIC|nr:hypothetical protein Vadar_019258 [Vaccinium darrowii]